VAEQRRDDDRGRDSEASSDERDLGWGGRDWDREADEDRDLDRLIADRPPHHEERER
jgi:hypothetical protein